MKTKMKAQKPKGKLGILLPGMGAVATTTIAGVLAVNKGIGLPIGSLTQMGRMRIGKRTENKQPLIQDIVPLQPLKNIVFGGWDVFEDNAYEAAKHAEVLEKDLLKKLKPQLEKIKPMKAVFDHEYVKRLDGRHVKKGATKMDLAEALMKDIEKFKKENDCDRIVMVWCGSTEIYIKESEVHQSLEALEKGLRENHRDIPPSMIYAYAWSNWQNKQVRP